MRQIIKIEKEYNIKTLKLNAEVRYWDDAEVNGETVSESGKELPCAIGENWYIEIDIDSGQITNWEEGKTADVHFKVCDMCSFDIVDDIGDIVYQVENEYVPEILSLGRNGYGDYIIMKIDGTGMIENWNNSLVSKIFEYEED